MDKRWQLACLISLILLCAHGKAQVTFSSLKDVYAWIEGKNFTREELAIKSAQARKARIAAFIGIPDVSGSLQLSYTHNTQLPVSLFPGEIFGGAPGTYQEVQTGVPYVTAFNQSLDIKLLHMAGWENLRLSAINQAVVEAEGRLTIQSLKEQVAASYFNIQLLMKNQTSTQDNLHAVKILQATTEDRFRNGLASKQAFNDATALMLEMESSLYQIQNLILQEINGLKKLCDIRPDQAVEVSELAASELTGVSQVLLPTMQSVRVAEMKAKRAKVNYRQLYFTQYPTISFYQQYASQQFNTRSKIFDNSVSWIQSSYIGLKISVPIPSANTIKQVNQAKYDYLLAENLYNKEKLHAVHDLEKKSAEAARYSNQLQYYQQILDLKTESYNLNEGLFKEGLIDLSKTMDSFREMVTATYNLNTASVNLMLARERIHINNEPL
jgi:outer membrane protein TolC